MPDNFNTIQGTEVINVNDAIQGSHAITLDTLKTFVATVLTSGSGTTANGTAVDLGGTLTGSTTITGVDQFKINGSNTGFFLDNVNKQVLIGDTELALNGDIIKVNTQTNLAYYDNTTHTGFFGINTDTPTVALDVVGAAAFTGPVRLAVTTVGALPGGNQGDMMMVTDALAPAYGVAVAAGGAVVTKVFLQWCCVDSRIINKTINKQK